MAKLKLTRTEKALAILLVGIAIFAAGSMAFTSVLNPTDVNITWRDSAGSEVNIDTTPLIPGQTYRVTVSASPLIFADESKDAWILGEAKIEICNPTTLSVLATYKYRIPETGTDKDPNSVLCRGFSPTINVIIPSNPVQYKARISVLYYLYTASIPYEPGKIPTTTYTCHFDTPNSAGWQTIYGKVLNAQIETWVWKRENGDIISDISTATVSGIITCEVTLGVTTYTDSVGTWNFDQTFVRVYAKTGAGYADQPTKEYTGIGSDLKYVITIDTTKIPNGLYKFTLGTSWMCGADKRIATLSIFYASFSAGAGTGIGGEPETIFGDTDILMVAAILALTGLAVCFLVRRRRR